MLNVLHQVTFPALVVARAYALRLRSRLILILVVVAVLAGCSEDAERGGVVEPRFVLGAPEAGQAIVRVDSAAEGDRVCDQAQLGDYDELQGIERLVIKPPDADQGRNGDGTQCLLPAQ